MKISPFGWIVNIGAESEPPKTSKVESAELE
jgi:hypothetical protein